MSAPAVVLFSEGFCPDCAAPLGDKGSARVDRNFCTGCRRYWNRYADGVHGIRFATPVAPARDWVPDTVVRD